MEETGILVGFLGFVISILIIVAFLVMASNVASLKTDSQKQSKLLRLLIESLPGARGIVGRTGTVRVPPFAGRNGRVLFMGDLWECSTSAKLRMGSQVRVVSIDGLVLGVDPV